MPLIKITLFSFIKPCSIAISTHLFPNRLIEPNSVIVSINSSLVTLSPPKNFSLTLKKVFRLRILFQVVLCHKQLIQNHYLFRVFLLSKYHLDSFYWCDCSASLTFHHFCSLLHQNLCIWFFAFRTKNKLFEIILN